MRLIKILTAVSILFVAALVHAPGASAAGSYGPYWTREGVTCRNYVSVSLNSYNRVVARATTYCNGNALLATDAYLSGPNVYEVKTTFCGITTRCLSSYTGPTNPSGTQKYCASGTASVGSFELLGYHKVCDYF